MREELKLIEKRSDLKIEKLPEDEDQQGCDTSEISVAKRGDGGIKGGIRGGIGSGSGMGSGSGKQIGFDKEGHPMVDASRMQKGPATAGRIDSSVWIPIKEHINNSMDIIRFPIESSHAYSYALLSPNSLALRLNVLKRSLEIIMERPELYKFIKTDVQLEESMGDSTSSCSGDTELGSSGTGIGIDDENTPSHKNRRVVSSLHVKNTQENFLLQSTASSAALAALFRPRMKRSDSFPVNHIYSSKDDASELKPELMGGPGRKLLKDIFTEIITLLEKDANLLSRESDVASALDELSLSSSQDYEEAKYDLLKNKLLYALATPFVEANLTISPFFGVHSNSVNPNFGANTSMSHVFDPSGCPTSPLVSSNGRPFHALSLGKHFLPQSVFTVETDHPWQVKAANDLAYLVFGVLYNMIKSLTLMDLIAPQFREFVSNRLTNSLYHNYQDTDDSDDAERDVIFAGDIVAVIKPADRSIAWTSMWAKKTGKILICMFEQIPCDAFDVEVLCNKDDVRDYQVDEFQDLSGELLKRSPRTIENLGDICSSMMSELRRGRGRSLHGDNPSQDVTDSEKINDTRYYTLQVRENENIPCAVTSFPLESNNDRFELKLKFHSLPYIAGMFVIKSSTNQIVSCNNAIAKNLFGRTATEITNKTIDQLIPDFTKILDHGLNDEKEAIDLVPGLVLPEHFFRRCDAAIRRRDCESEEELFFNSRGIIGRHRDGNSILIDVQLRVCSFDTFVLWVTFSRQNKHRKRRVSIDPTRLSAERSSLSSSPVSDILRASPGGSVSPSGRNNVRLPSQMRLLEKEGDHMEFPQVSHGIARKSSTRKPKSITFSVPLGESHNNLQEALLLTKLKHDGDSKKRNFSHTESVESDESGISHPQSSASSDTVATSISGNDAKTRKMSVSPAIGYLKCSEADILRLEDEMIENKIKTCPHWPTVVGSHRRTKKFSEFDVLKDMGEGAYGKVVLARHREDKDYTVSIKCIDKERILVDTWVRDRKLGTIPSEIQIMATMNQNPHPNVMRIVDFFEDLKYYYLETPLFGDPPAIDLFDFIEIKKGMTEVECRFIFKQIVLAVYYLHKSGIVHRDIKDENVIVDENGIIKLIDFGSAGYTKNKLFDVFVGTIDYASPEVLRGDKYEGKPQDVWALGILLYTMLYQENPFYSIDEIMGGDLRIPFVVSEGATRLIERILERDVTMRPTITDIVEDEWLHL